MDDEVCVSRGQTVEEIRTLVSSAPPVDYTLLFVFGPIQLLKMDRPWLELVVTVAGMTITERELNPGSPRCMLIFDDAAAESSDRVDGPASADRLSQSRTLYDRCLTNAEAGLVKVFPSSAETGAHAKISVVKQLLTAAQRWNPTGPGIMDIDEAVTRAQSVDETRNSAVLTYRGGRRLRHFPFSVVV